MLFNLQTAFLLALALLATTVPTVSALPGVVKDCGGLVCTQQFVTCDNVDCGNGRTCVVEKNDAKFPKCECPHIECVANGKDENNGKDRDCPDLICREIYLVCKESCTSGQTCSVTDAEFPKCECPQIECSNGNGNGNGNVPEHSETVTVIESPAPSETVVGAPAPSETVTVVEAPAPTTETVTVVGAPAPTTETVIESI
jgi:hypothetical protein